MNSSQDGGSRDTKSNAKPVEATSDVFDPFGLGVDSSWSRQENKSTVSPKPPPEVTRLTLFESPSRTSLPSAKKPTASPSALPPRVTVKLRIHEEVSSLARPSGEGASDASVDGTVYVSVSFLGVLSLSVGWARLIALLYYLCYVGASAMLGCNEKCAFCSRWKKCSRRTGCVSRE